MSLSEDGKCYLLDYLNSFIEKKQNKKAIKEIVDNFLLSGKSYGVYEILPFIVLVLNSSPKREVSINIGYPFPIYNKKVESNLLKTKGNIELKIHVRGEILRRKQRDFIKETLEDVFEKTEWISINSFKKFREKYHFKKGYWLYVDPYNFIGDSFVGLYFIDYFKGFFNLKQVAVLSKAYKHTKFFYSSYSKTKNNFKKLSERAEVVVMPDLIDNHLNVNIELLKELKGKKIIVLLLGRNIIIKINGNTCLLYHLNREDVLLRNKNIEDYMDDCLFPYIEPKKEKYFLPKREGEGRDGKKFFINPHAGDSLKELPTEMVLEIARKLIKKNGSFIYISRGTNSDQKWVNSFLKKLKNEKYKPFSENIIFLPDSGLNDLGEKLQKFNISVALTSDTAVAHLLSRIIPNIIVFNDVFWDYESIQSLSAESPLGFCRFYSPQYPAILKKTNNKKSFINTIVGSIEALSSQNTFSSREINSFITYLAKHLENLREREVSYAKHKKLYKKYLRLKKNHKNSKIYWLFELYDPDEMVLGMSPKRGREAFPLIYSAWKNLPLYKFFLSEKTSKNKKELQKQMLL